MVSLVFLVIVFEFLGLELIWDRFILFGCTNVMLGQIDIVIGVFYDLRMKVLAYIILMLSEIDVFFFLRVDFNSCTQNFIIDNSFFNLIRFCFIDFKIDNVIWVRIILKSWGILNFKIIMIGRQHVQRITHTRRLLIIFRSRLLVIVTLDAILAGVLYRYITLTTRCHALIRASNLSFIRALFLSFNLLFFC